MWTLGKKGPRYTPKEARARIPVLLRRIALTAVDVTMQLDKYPIDSQVIETRVLALSGLAGLLTRLCHIIWRHEALKRLVEPPAT